MAVLDASKPKLAAGCRWGGSKEEPVILFPEGAIRVQGTGIAVLELCDGQRTFYEIVEALHRLYSASDRNLIRDDAAGFLERMNEKRIVDF